LKLILALKNVVKLLTLCYRFETLQLFRRQLVYW